jgi:hypothetical protein
VGLVDAIPERFVIVTVMAVGLAKVIILLMIWIVFGIVSCEPKLLTRVLLRLTVEPLVKDVYEGNTIVMVSFEAKIFAVRNVKDRLYC